MKKLSVGVLFLAASLHGVAHLRADFLLIDDTGAHAVIVVDDQQPLSAQLATRALNRYLERSTGTRLEVRRAVDIDGDTLDPDQNWVLIGDSRFLRAQGINPDEMAYGEFAVSVAGNVLAIAGRDYPEQADVHEAYPDATVFYAGSDHLNQRFQRVDLDHAALHYWVSGGTLYGVYQLLEEELGIRWLWPGEVGTVIPSHDRVVVASRVTRQAPALRIRWLRNHFVSRDRDAQTDRRLPRYQQDEWWRANRQGVQQHFRANHAFNAWWDRFSEDHPEFFAYQRIGGTRVAEIVARRHINLCQSEPGVVDQFIEDAVAYFDSDPHLLTVSASPGDAPGRGECMCDDCLQLDPPDAPPITLYDGDTREPFEHVSLTDRHVNWWNRMADRLRETHPDRFIAAWAYGTYRHPPVRESLRDNIKIGFVGFNWVDGEALARDREFWQGWSKAASHLLLRPNAFHSGLAFPLNYSREMARDIRTCYETGMFGAEFDSLIGHWPTQGLNYYVLTRVMWDPHLDVDALIQDYCEAGFGPAATQIRAYFDLLETMSDEVRERVGAHTRAGTTWVVQAEEVTEDDLGRVPEVAPEEAPVDMEEAPRWITRRVRPRERLALIARVFLTYEEALRAHLDEARSALGEGDEAYLARIDFLARGLDYAHIESDLLDVWFSAETDDLLARIEARDAFIESISGDFMLNVTYLRNRHARNGMTARFFHNERRYRRE